MDIILVYATIGFLIGIYYVFSKLSIINPLFFIPMILLSIPTIMALYKGAPFVPTPMKRTKQMVKLANIKKNQKVYDLGCGDGRFVYIAANKYKAKAMGIELSPIIFLLAIIRKIHWKSKAKIVFGSFKNINLKDADVIFCYLMPDTIKKMEKSFFKNLKKGCKIFSYAFKIEGFKNIGSLPSDPKLNLAPAWIYEKE